MTYPGFRVIISFSFHFAFAFILATFSSFQFILIYKNSWKIIITMLSFCFSNIFEKVKIKIKNLSFCFVKNLLKVCLLIFVPMGISWNDHSFRFHFTKVEQLSTFKIERKMKAKANQSDQITTVNWQDEFVVKTLISHENPEKSINYHEREKEPKMKPKQQDFTTLN